MTIVKYTLIHTSDRSIFTVDETVEEVVQLLESTDEPFAFIAQRGHDDCTAVRISAVTAITPGSFERHDIGS